MSCKLCAGCIPEDQSPSPTARPEKPPEMRKPSPPPEMPKPAPQMQSEEKKRSEKEERRKPKKIRKAQRQTSEYKRNLHLSVVNSDAQAWDSAITNALQYCRHTFSPGTWHKVKGHVSKVYGPEKLEVKQMKSRDKQKNRDLRNNKSSNQSWVNNT